MEKSVNTENIKTVFFNIIYCKYLQRGHMIYIFNTVNKYNKKEKTPN